MDKKDIIYVVAALGIILVIALVIKPIATGQPVNTGLAFLLPTPTPTPVPTYIPIQNIPLATTIPTIPTTPPTPVPTWDAKTKTVAFVNPETYGISMNQSLPHGSRFNTTQPDTNMTTYATISGQYSGTTQIINIPFPYWELTYTVTPTVGPSGGTQPGVGEATTPTREFGWFAQRIRRILFQCISGIYHPGHGCR